MDDSDDGMWVHYAKYCENIAKQKYKRCLTMAKWCHAEADIADSFHDMLRYNKWHERWLALAEKFKDK